MRILFLHLSDLHIKDKHGVNVFQLKKISDATNSFGSVDYMLIILSGDIAFSGVQQQYESAYHCIGNLISKVNRNGFTGKIDVLCVPGNHDINRNGKPRLSKDLQAINKFNSYDQYINRELEKQKSFMDYSKRNHCFEDYGIYCQRIINIGSFKIEVNLINSAVFSILEEDKGLHYIPQHCLNKMEVPTNADFVITVMHHSPEWYIDDEKNALDRIIYSKSSLVFYRHEHYIGNKTISYENSPFALVQTGGKLCDNDNWADSSFYISVLDTDSHLYKQHKFRWNVKQQQYEQSDLCETILKHKPSIENRFEISSAYKEWLNRDPKHNISSSFLDYYVFPRLQAEEQESITVREYIKEEEFIEDILKKKKVLIYGGYNSGKTTLLKSLFISLSKEYSVLFCRISNIRGSVVDRIIKDSFVNVYGECESDYIRFLQTPKNRRVLLIDDVENIQQKSFNYLLKQLSDRFEYIILTSNEAVDVDLIERMKLILKANESVYRFRILPLFSDKRQELIQKIISLKVTDQKEASRVSNLLARSIKAQLRFVSLDPDFIIKFIEYYCNNLLDASSSDSGVFSKVFEANLTYALSNYQTPRLSVDKLFVLLSKVAYFIHFNKVYPISKGQIVSVIENYNNDYGADVKSNDAIEAMISAKILVNEESVYYRFADRSYLAYFVAREVNSQYNTTRSNADLQYILKCACFGINADILMFLSYITDNIQILNCILHMANELTSNWPEFNFMDECPKYLKADKTHVILPPESNAKQKEEAEEVESERDMLQEIQTVDIYDYTEEEADRFINQIIRAGSLLIIIAKCLPNFEHNMPKVDKDKFVDAIYRIPNRIFGLWAEETDKSAKELISFFRSRNQNYYAREKEVSDDDILRALQWVSISLLLELYNLSMMNASKDNTACYLSAFDYSKQSTYELEYLMALERVGAQNSFVDNSLELEKQDDCNIFFVALRRIVKHALVTMNGLDFRLRQKLQDKFFPRVEMQKRIIAQRIAIEGRKGQ